MLNANKMTYSLFFIMLANSVSKETVQEKCYRSEVSGTVASLEVRWDQELISDYSVV